MALQTTGQISLKNIADEFGDTAPHSMSEFYGASTGIPSSGAISLTQFYGVSADASIGTILDIDFSIVPYAPIGESTLSYDPDQDRFLFVYSDYRSADEQYCRVIKINADKTITLGNQYSFGFNSDKKSVDYDTNVNKFVVLFRDQIDGEKMKARSITINDMSITFGTVITLDSSGNLGDCLIKFDDSSNRFLAVYEDDDDTDPIYASVLQCNSNGTITNHGQSTIVASGGYQLGVLNYDPYNNSFMTVYNVSGYYTCNITTISGNTASHGPARTLWGITAGTDPGGAQGNPSSGTGDQTTWGFNTIHNNFAVVTVDGNLGVTHIRAVTISGTNISISTRTVVPKSSGASQNDFQSLNTYDNSTNKFVSFELCYNNTISPVRGQIFLREMKQLNSTGTSWSFTTSPSIKIDDSYDTVELEFYNLQCLKYGNGSSLAIFRYGDYNTDPLTEGYKLIPFYTSSN